MPVIEITFPSKKEVKGDKTHEKENTRTGAVRWDVAAGWLRIGSWGN